MDREEIIRACYEIPGQTWPTELGWLYDKFKDSKAHAEIGVYCGRSLIASIGGMSDACIFCCDNDSFGVDSSWVQEVRSTTIRHYKPDSVDLILSALNSIDFAAQMQILGKKFDSIFIDGCHEYAECKADIEAWLPLLNNDGIICGHDYWSAHVGVMDAVNEVFGDRFSVFSGTRIWYVNNEIRS